MEWEILTDMLSETSMKFMGVIDYLVLAKGIKREGCYYNVAIQGTYLSLTHGLERLP